VSTATVEQERILHSEDMFQVWAALTDRAEELRDRAERLDGRRAEYLVRQAEHCEALADVFTARTAVVLEATR